MTFPIIMKSKHFATLLLVPAVLSTAHAQNRETASVRVSGFGTGVGFQGGVQTFLNSAGGTISSSIRDAVELQDDVGTFTNNGTLYGAGYSVVSSRGDITSFVNNGLIQNTDATQVDIGQYGGSVLDFQTDTTVGGTVTSFVNTGTILAASNQTAGHYRGTIGFYENGNGANALSSFQNSGTISGPGTAVNFDGTVTSFGNSGTIAGAGYNVLNFNAGVTSFTNSGTLQNTDATHVDAMDFGGQAVNVNIDTVTGAVVTSFINTGTIYQ